MRILLVSDLDPLRVIGGGERLLAGHAAGLADRRHEVIVCSGTAAPAGVLGGKFRIIRVRRSLASPRRAAAAVRRLRPDVIVGYQPALAIGALRAARRLGIPTVYVFSSSWPEEYRARRRRPRWSGVALRRAVERGCLRESDRVAVLSEYGAAQVRAVHPRLDPALEIVAGAVDPVRFSPNGSREAARRRLGLAAGGPLLVSVRNLVPRMGLANLIDAMPKVLAEFPDAQLIVAGEGPLLWDLMGQARRLGLSSRVLFSGFVPEEQLPDYYRAADLAVIPTRELEGFGLATVEALACGTPVVGTPVGATPEILGPLEPSLVTHDTTAEAIAHGIVELLSRDVGDLPERCRQHVLEMYTWERSAAELEAVIRGVVR